MDISILKQQKVKMKLTYDQLAELSGIPKTTVTNIMTGRTENPRIDTLIAIGKALGISDEWTAEERAQGVIDHKKISVTADEETLIECYRTIGRKFGKKKQENFIKLAELYAEEEG